jgi:hypothetical protein
MVKNIAPTATSTRRCLFLNSIERNEMETIVILTITHKKHVPDLLDKIAGWAYTLVGGDGNEIAEMALQELATEAQAIGAYD